MDVPAITGINPFTEKEVERHADADEPFAALAFKITTDPFVGRIAFEPLPSKQYEEQLNELNTVESTQYSKAA